jgi:hypothetical protein
LFETSRDIHRQVAVANLYDLFWVELVSDQKILLIKIMGLVVASHQCGYTIVSRSTDEMLWGSVTDCFLAFIACSDFVLDQGMATFQFEI